MASSSIGAVSLTVMFFWPSWDIRVGALAPPITASSMPSRSALVLFSIIWFSMKPNRTG